MAEPPTDFESDWPERKPGSRMVWIVPSVALHVALIGVWFAMPENEARKPEKRVIIKSEQVEQLKDHIEDANLQELHQELRRLQEIKQAMAEIRAKEMVALEEFEQDMRGSLDGDTRQSLADLAAAQDGLSKSQDSVLQGLRKIDELFKQMQPHLDSKALHEITPQARLVLDIRNGLKPKQEQMDQQFMMLQAKFDAAEAVFGWITSGDVATKWDELVKLHERIFVLQSASSDELGRLQNQQSEALRRLVDGNGGIAQQIQQSLDQEKKAQADYESEKVTHSENLKKSEADIKEAELKVAELEAQVAANRKERELLGKEWSRLHGNSPEIRQKRDQIQKGYKDIDRRFTAIHQERKKASNALQQAKNLRQRSEQRLKQIRPPNNKGAEHRLRLAQSMERDLQAIEGKAGNLSGQEEAFELLTGALQQTQTLITAVEQTKEESK